MFVVLHLFKVQLIFHTPSKVANANVGNDVLLGYNWSLGWSLSASGLTVWPGEGAWGGWATGGSPCDKDMALGTIPSTAEGMPGGATLTTPGGYLLREGKEDSLDTSALEHKHLNSQVFLLRWHFINSAHCQYVNA